ncbi:MAG: hypothetical protein GXP61_04055, partial [Epsilonproteobacteria bacterium]|nr:hypothetical protein [Campylobacterota bacterium]
KYRQNREKNIKLTEEFPEHKNFDFSLKTRENINKIRDILDKEILPLQSRANNSNDIHKINEFIAKVSILAKEYDIAVLEDYVEQINKAIDIFDVKKIKKFLKKFIDIEKTLL